MYLFIAFMLKECGFFDSYVMLSEINTCIGDIVTAVGGSQAFFVVSDLCNVRVSYSNLEAVPLSLANLGRLLLLHKSVFVLVAAKRCLVVIAYVGQWRML
jgi:hypothetical protein